VLRNGSRREKSSGDLVVEYPNGYEKEEGARRAKTEQSCFQSWRTSGRWGGGGGGVFSGVVGGGGVVFLMGGGGGGGCVDGGFGEVSIWGVRKRKYCHDLLHQAVAFARRD